MLVTGMLVSFSGIPIAEPASENQRSQTFSTRPEQGEFDVIKSISYWSMPEGLAGRCPIDEALVMAQATGFEGMELCIGVDGVLTPDTPESECKRIREQVERSGLIVQTLASGMSWASSPTSNQPEVREHCFDLHAKALQRAAWLGCKAMLFVPGVVNSPIAPGEQVPYELAIERARSMIGRLLEHAEQLDVDLCLENVWNGLFLSPVEFAGFVDSFESSRVGIYFDAGNVIRYHQYPPHWIQYLGRRIKRVHVKGFAESFEAGSYSFCDLGAGDIDWTGTIASLKSIGYDGTIVAEMLPFSPGLLERTSAALDEILQRPSFRAEGTKHRFDPAEIVDPKSVEGVTKRSDAAVDRRG